MGNIIMPGAMKDFDSAAARPVFSAMSNEKLSKELGVEIPDWKSAVDRFIEDVDREI